VTSIPPIANLRSNRHRSNQISRKLGILNRVMLFGRWYYDSVAFRFIAANEHPDHRRDSPNRRFNRRLLPSAAAA
jgi:hypothetical protein